MRRYQAGDRKAFDALVGLLGPSLHRFFLHGFRDPGLAEDLYQETWMKVHSARKSHRPGEPVLPWLYGIARHVAADSRRRYARHRRRIDATQAVVHSLGADGGHAQAPDAEVRAETSEILQAAMADLPDKQREALILLKVEGLSVVEAAKAAGTTPGALKVRAHRAYAHVRAWVEQSEREDREDASS